MKLVSTLLRLSCTQIFGVLVEYLCWLQIFRHFYWWIFLIHLNILNERMLRVISYFSVFSAQVQTQFGQNIKNSRCDNAREYFLGCFLHLGVITTYYINPHVLVLVQKYSSKQWRWYMWASLDETISFRILWIGDSKPMNLCCNNL